MFKGFNLINQTFRMTTTQNILPLTQHNLDLLLKQYENEIGKLDPVRNPDHVCFYWDGPRNRFYDVRRDNSYYNTALQEFYRCKSEDVWDDNGITFARECTCKICQDEVDECSENTEERIDFVHRACPERFKYTELKDKCTVKIVEEPSFHLAFENIPKTIYDGQPDPYHLRVRGSTQRGEIEIINLESIPIIQKNLIRLKKELVRQEAFKWTMAVIRTRGLVKTRLSLWSVINDKDEQVQLYLPRELVIQIMYWLTF